jgi:hypothetical protein
MAYYRLYFFRSDTGRIREAREFEAPHDFAAIYCAEQWRSGEQMELWSGSRRVTRWTDDRFACATPDKQQAAS